MRYANIVHLSDLHLQSVEADNFNASRVIGALLEDLARLKDTQHRPDFIVFTGDLVQTPDDHVAITNAKQLLLDIAAAAGLDENRLFLCPGNHDASRIAVGPNIPNLKKYRSLALDVNGLNGLATNPELIAHVGKAFASYATLADDFGSSFRTSNNALVTKYYLRDLNTSIIAINSSFLTGCGLSDDVSDEKNLAFPEYSLVKALQDIPDGAEVILVSHHPLNFLSETTVHALEPLILQKVDLYMCGHMHLATPRSIVAPQGECTHAQSGSLYASRDWWNGYSIVSYVPGEPHFRITYRKWHEQRRQFGSASDLSDDGIVYNSPTSKSFWSTVTPKLDVRLLEKWRENSLLPYLREEFGPDFADMCEQGTFVEPDFERDAYIETENGLEKTSRVETIEFSTAVESSDNLVIGAQEESGKTTLIRQWALRAASEVITGSHWTIPVVLRFSEIKTYVKAIENLIKQKLPNLPTSISSIDLLSNGVLTVFVDDIELKSGKAKQAFDEFVLKYPTCRFILLTGTVYLRGAGIAPVIVPGIPFSHLRLKQLKASKLLTLIENHGTRDPTQADRLLQRMVQEASSLNVPITPVTGTFFIQIYTEDASQPLINRANLVERYIEISLEKFAPQELLPSSFDFHNKSDLLSFIAEHMCRQSVRELSEEQFINLISEYMNEYGLRFSSIDLLEYFVKAKILQRSEHFVTFRLNAFLEYFSALRMVGHPGFRNWVLDDARYLSYCNEITFYAAMSRKDQEWLTTLYERFQQTSKQVWDTMPKEVQDGTLIENFAPPLATAKEAEVLEVEKKIFETPLNENERRELLDDDGPIAQLPTTGLQRTLATDPGEQWLAQLTLLSGMLKNMELVPSKLKKEMLKEVLQGWLKFLSLSMGVVPTLAKERKLKLAGIDYIVLFPDGMDIAEVARRIFMYMPISTAKIATYHLGTEKLRVQLEEGVGASLDEMSAGQQFMRTTILAQLGVDDLGSVTRKAATALEDKGYLSSVFVRMLAEIVVRFRLPDRELKEIGLVAAETIARLEGKTGQRAAMRKGQVIEALKSNRQKLNFSERATSD